MKLKPDLFLGNNPYYFKYSIVRFTSLEKLANLDDCWEVISPSEKDFELMKKGKLHINRCDFPIHKVSINLCYQVLNVLRKKTCNNICKGIPCGEQCVHCKCLNCWICPSGLIDFWEIKC